MKIIYFVFFLLILPSALIYSQDVSVQKAVPNGFGTVQNPDWGNDVLVSAFEPIGPMSGVKAANGNMYLAVNDTLATGNLGLIIYQSSNNGNTWSLFPSGITLRTNYPRIKMLSVGDSVLCLFLTSNSVYRWNINSGAISQFSTYQCLDFDAVQSSTNAIYLMVQTTANDLRRFGSADYGLTWTASTGLVASNSGRPRATMSATGDTLVINYRSGLISPPENTQVNSFRYRQTGAGVIAFTGSSVVTVPSGTFRSEYKSVYRGNILWFIYTEGQTGSIDLFYKLSTDNGVTFGTAAQISGQPGRDEYWFDALLGTGTSFTGLDLAYYSDSLQAGSPTNASDKMMYVGAPVSSPSSFGAPFQFSQHPPVWSAAGYSPAMIEIPGQSDVGIAWVGVDAGSRKIYWDRYTFVTSVEQEGNSVPSAYVLSQNYPNPFNPSTKISFSLPQSGFTTLKVYNMLGKEISVLVSKEMSAGAYSVQFDASKLSSGIYFYELNVNGFKEVKKMALQK